MKMCGYDDEEDANGSRNANSTAAYAKDSTVDDSTVVTKEWVYESDGGSASCSLEGNKKVVGNLGETSVIFIRAVAPDCSDLIVLKGDPLPLASSTKEGKNAGTIRISFTFGGEDYRVLAMDGMYATQPSDMLLKKLFTEKSMTVKLPSGDRVDFNLPDFKECASRLQAFIGTKCNSF